MASPTGPADHTVLVRSLRLHYLEWPDSAGKPPLLFLHGLQDCARCWDFHASVMSRWFRVLALDRRGHGDSEWAPGGAYGLADYAGDLAEFIERLGLQNLTLVGRASAGKCASIYAAEHPERIAKLIIIETDPGATNQESQRLLARHRSEPDVYANPDAVLVRLRNRVPGASAETLWHHARVLTKALPSGGFTWKRDRAVLTNYEQVDVWEYLPRIKAPTLVVRGEYSPLLRKDRAERIGQTIPDCRIAEIKNAGHWCQDENPEGFQQALRRFLGV